MGKQLKDATQLMPVVKRAVKALYGEGMKDVKLLKADMFPLFREPKQGWLVHTEFSDEKFEYAVQMDINMSDGQITRSVELHRNPLKEC